MIMPIITAVALGALASLISILAVDARKPLRWLEDVIEEKSEQQHQDEFLHATSTGPPTCPE